MGAVQEVPLNGSRRLRFDCHLHTHLCGHARGRPEEYVSCARDRGIDLVTFTCHIPISGNAFLQEGIRMNLSDLPAYRQMVERARIHGQTIGVKVLYGIEAEVFPENERLKSMARLLEKEPFDFVLGSLHHQLPSYRRYLYDKGFHRDREIVDRYFEDLSRGAASGLYHSMSHPDVIRIYGTVDYFDPSDHEASIRGFLKSLVENDVCMEVNTSGLSKGVYEVHPDPLILQWAKSMGVRLTIGSDSHRPDHVGQHFPRVLEQLCKIGFRELCYFDAGRRIPVPMERILT